MMILPEVSYKILVMPLNRNRKDDIMSKVTFCARNDVYAYPAKRKAANGVSYLSGPTKYVEVISNMG